VGGETPGKILKLQREAVDRPWLAAECLTALVRGANEENEEEDEQAFAGALLVAEAIANLRRLAGSAR